MLAAHSHTARITAVNTQSIRSILQKVTPNLTKTVIFIHFFLSKVSNITCLHAYMQKMFIVINFQFVHRIKYVFQLIFAKTEIAPHKFTGGHFSLLFLQLFF